MINISGEIRKFVANALGASQKPLRLTSNESLATALVEPANYELSRAGLRYYGGGQNGLTGRAPVTALPTTAAAFLLYNNDPWASYVIEQVSIVQISGTAAVGGVILAALTKNKLTTLPTAATGYASVSASQGGRATKAIWADAATLADTAVWYALKGNANAAVATIGGDTANVDGAIIIPPGYALGLNYFSAAGTTPLFTAYARWTEIVSALE